jgi:hypothetical protein
VKHVQHSDKHTCNIRLEKQLKHWEQKLATYVYIHCNICNILIYFYCFTISTRNTCNIQMKHLKHLKDSFATCISSAQCHLVVWTNHRARRRRDAWSSTAWVSTCSLPWANGGRVWHAGVWRHHEGWRWRRARVA